MKATSKRKTKAGVPRWLRTLWKPLALSGAAGVGAGVALMGAPDRGASGDLDIPDHQGGWIFGSGCDWESRADPINFVFVGRGATTGNVKSHAGNHGNFGDHGGSTKYFIDHGGNCYPMDDQASTGF